MHSFLLEQKDRIRRIAISEPIHRLDSLRKYDGLLMRDLGISVLLFILESMYTFERNCTYEKIAQFLQGLIYEQFGKDMTYDEAYELTLSLVQEHLWNSGKPFEYTYWDYEDKKQKVFKFHLLVLDEYQIQDKASRFKLSTEGLEFLFQTKEYYSEIQISVSQLYLRQQIKKGVFADALRTVDDLILAIHHEKSRIRQLMDKISRDVLEVAKSNQYKEQLERINDRLEMEREAFKDLQSLAADTMNRIYDGKATEKERAASESMAKLQRRLIDAYYEHESLFTEKMNVQERMGQSLQAMIFQAFTVRINMEKEIWSWIVDKKASLGQLKAVVDPMLSPVFHRSFHPGQAFSSQWMRKKRKKEDEQLLDALGEAELLALEQEEERKQQEKVLHYQTALQSLLQHLADRRQYSVADIAASLDDPILAAMILVQLHQMGPIWWTEIQEISHIEDPLIRALSKLNGLDIPNFVVEVGEGSTSLSETISISNFKLSRWEEEYGFERMGASL